MKVTLLVFIFTTVLASILSNPVPEGASEDQANAASADGAVVEDRNVSPVAVEAHLRNKRSPRYVPSEEDEESEEIPIFYYNRRRGRLGPNNDNPCYPYFCGYKPPTRNEESNRPALKLCTPACCEDRCRQSGNSYADPEYLRPPVTNHNRYPEPRENNNFPRIGQNFGLPKWDSNGNRVFN